MILHRCKLLFSSFFSSTGLDLSRLGQNLLSAAERLQYHSDIRLFNHEEALLTEHKNDTLDLSDTISQK